MGPNEQNQHFAELRQKVCVYIHAVVLLRGLSSLEGKNELLVGKKRLAESSQTDYIIQPQAIKPYHTQNHYVPCLLHAYLYSRKRTKKEIM